MKIKEIDFKTLDNKFDNLYSIATKLINANNRLINENLELRQRLFELEYKLKLSQLNLDYNINEN